MVTDPGEAAMMTERGQVLGDLLHSQAIVHPNSCDVPTRRGEIVEHDRKFGGGELLDDVGVYFGDDGGETCDATPHHEAGAFHELSRFVVCICYYDFVTTAVRLGLNLVRYIEEKGVLEIRNENTERLAFARCQRTCVQVGTIFQFRDD